MLFDKNELETWKRLMKERGINTWFYIGWFPLNRYEDGLGIVILQSYMTVATR